MPRHHYTYLRSSAGCRYTTCDAVSTILRSDVILPSYRDDANKNGPKRMKL